jgi:ELWxxDGT repeat protein
VADNVELGAGPANVNGTLFFAAFDREKGTQLMKIDGTAAGTVIVKELYRADGSRPCLSFAGGQFGFVLSRQTGQ